MPRPHEASTRNLRAVAKARHETKPSEMCIQSQFGQVFGLYGNPERNRGQSLPAESGNELSSSNHPKGITIIDWSAGGSWAVHISFYRLDDTIFYYPEGSQTDWVE